MPASQLSAKAVFRLVAGFFVMPIVTGILTFGLYALLISTIGDVVFDGPATLMFGGGMAASAAYIAVPITCFVAFPAFLWKRKRGGLSFLTVVLCGVAIVEGLYVVVAAGAISLMTPSGPNRHPAAFADQLGRAAAFMTFSALVAAGSAAVFWVIAIRGSEPSRQTNSFETN